MHECDRGYDQLKAACQISCFFIRSNVVVPIIEVINADTLAYHAAQVPDQRGGFSWDLFYKWKPIPADEQHLRKSPIDVIR